jgi:O-antigen/teichoic acid export membrane protein
MMATRRVLSQAGFYALSIVATRAIGLIMVPYVTRQLSTGEYGAIELMNTITDVATTVLAFGQVDALFRFVAAERDDADRRRVAAEAFGLVLGLAAVAILAMQALAPPIEILLAHQVPSLALRFLLVTVALEGAIEVPLAWLRFRERSQFYVAIIIGRAALQAALVFVMLEAGAGVPGVMAASLIAAATTATVMIVAQCLDTGIRFNRNTAARLLHYGAPLIFSGLGGFVLGTFDRILLARAVPVSAVAIYAIAYKVAILTPQLFQPFAMWWFPRRIQLLLEPDGALRSARTVTFGLTFLYWLGFGVATGGVPLIRLMTPPDYHAAIGFLPWLVLATVVQHTADMVCTGSYAGSSTRMPMLINVGAALVAFVFYVLLIPRYGVAGAIAATIIGWSARLVAIFIDSQRKIAFRLPWFRLALFAAIMTLVASLLPQDLDIPSAIAASALGTVLAAILGNALGLAPIPDGVLRRLRFRAAVPP